MDKKIGTPYDYRQLREIINANHDRFSELNYDTSLSLPQKMNSLVEWFKVLLQEYDEWIKYLDEFQDKFDENLYTTVYDIIAKWLTDGVITEIIVGIGKILEIYPILEWEKPIQHLIDKRYPYNDAYRYGFKDDYIDDVCGCVDNAIIFDEVYPHLPPTHTLNFRTMHNGVYKFGHTITITKDKTLNLIGETVGFSNEKTRFFFTNVDNNNGIVYSARNGLIKTIHIKGVGKGVDGAGLNIMGSAPYYVAYVIVEDVTIEDFSLGMFTGDSFYITYRWGLIRNCSQGFVANNCSTTLAMEKVYTLNCGSGFSFTKINYSTLINCASDNIDGIAYRINNSATISLVSCGCEQIGNTCLYVQDSRGISVNGFTALGTHNGDNFSSVLAVVRSNISVNGLDEVDAYSQTGYSVSVDPTSVLTLSSVNIKNKIEINSTAKIFGSCKQGSLLKNFKGTHVEYYTDMFNDPNIKKGDVIKNYNPTPANPIESWVCIERNISTNSNTWRPLNYVTFNHATKDTLPNLEKTRDIGVMATIDSLTLVMFNGSDWKKVNLVGIDS